jgi:Protein of unknown function (DUF3011)
MSGSRFHRAISATLCVVMAVGPLTVQAQSTIRCESESYRYRYCPTRTDNRVNLLRQLSKTYCRQGSTWGYDRGGIWVDGGCGGEFQVGGGLGRGGNNKDAAAAVAAIAGIAILGAMANNRNNQVQQDVTSWSVGNFSGYDSYEGMNVQVNIMPGGNLSGHAGSNSFSGYVRGNRMDAGRHTFRLSRQGNGFLAVDEQDSSHQVVFQRTGGGY